MMGFLRLLKILKNFFCIVGFVCFVIPAVATANPENSFSDELGHTFSARTLENDFISPLTTDAKYPLMIGSVLTATVMIFRHDIEEPFFDDHLFYTHPLGTAGIGDKLGLAVPNITYYLGMAGAYYITRNYKYSRRANLMLRSTIHSSLLSTLAKVTAREG